MDGSMKAGALPTLDEIGTRLGTDKASGQHDFLRFYAGFFDSLRSEADFSMLEIGVYNGASLRMWEEYFLSGTIVGVDINPATLQYATSRCPVIIADQSNMLALSDIDRKYGPFNIIVDDGSHFWQHQIASFRYLFGSVKPGGYYVMEDLDTSFGTFGQTYSPMSDISAADYLHKICDYVVGDRFAGLGDEPDAFIRSYAPVIETISYYRRTCVIKRRQES